MLAVGIAPQFTIMITGVASGDLAWSLATLSNIAPLLMFLVLVTGSVFTLNRQASLPAAIVSMGVALGIFSALFWGTRYLSNYEQVGV